VSTISHCRVLALVFGIILFTETTSRADIAPQPLSGGKNLSIKGKAKTNVAMVDEVVKLRLSKGTCRVDVVFTMKNIGTTPETMEVGFPCNYQNELQNFTATIDDTSVKVSNKSETTKEQYIDDIQRERTTFWKTWEMTFQPETPVKIGVSYFTKLRDDFGRRQHEVPVAEHLAAFAPPNERAALEKKLVSRHIDYYLRTGSHWSGPIGRCRIEVTFDGLTTDNLDPSKLFFEREQATITSDKIVWDLKDYEPKQDVELSITPGTTAKETLALLEKTHQQHPEAVDITIMLSEFLTAANRQPEADKLLLELLTHWQDKITFWGDDSEDMKTLQRSSDVFYLILKRTDEQSHPVPFLNPAEFTPVIEHIALRVQKQAKLAPPLYKDSVSLYLKNIDQMLAWCRKYPKPE
jgi:hypothetical protein